MQKERPDPIPPTPHSPRSRNCRPASRGGSSPRRRSRTAPWSGIPAGATVWGSIGILALGPVPYGATKVSQPSQKRRTRIGVFLNKRGESFTAIWESPSLRGTSSDFAFPLFHPKVSAKNGRLIFPEVLRTPTLSRNGSAIQVMLCLKRAAKTYDYPVCCRLAFACQH